MDPLWKKMGFQAFWLQLHTQKCLYMQKSKVHRTNMHFQSGWCFQYDLLQQNIYLVHRITYELENINRQVFLQSILVCRKFIVRVSSL